MIDKTRVWWSCAIVLTLLACRSASADTITMKDNISIHGSLLEMSNGLLRIRVRFPSEEEKEATIPVKDVQSIEFNLLTFNSGAPPKILGFGPPNRQNASQKEPHSEDVVVLHGGARLSCILVGIDTDRVHCDPNDFSYSRSAVLRIVLGSK